MSEKLEKKPHPWDSFALFAKAQQYADIMKLQDHDDWKYGFWSALTLELVARSALSKTSPVLLAELKNWNHIYFALGNQPNERKYKPRSIGTSEVFNRIESIHPTFTREQNSFCVLHMERRNSEVHSGDLAFDGIGTSTWLAKFYLVCDILTKIIGESLETLFGIGESQKAKILIEAHDDENAKTVNKTVNAYKTIWENKTVEERETLAKQAGLVATKHHGHRVNCPACQTTGLLQGSPVGSPAQSIENDLVIEKQPMLPSQFECVACGLKVAGFSKLNACDLGDSFTSKSQYDAVEFFGIEPSEWDGFEDDNNE